MEEIFKIAGAILISFGGSGAILFVLSSWLGKVWANRILETEKKNLTIEIEEYKNKLDKEIKIVSSLIDKSVYVSKLQYDKEFSIYLEIWGKLAECVSSTIDLYPTFQKTPTDEKELEAFNKAKMCKFVEKYNDFSDAIIKYAPFYNDKLYKGFIELRNVCCKQGNAFTMYEFDVKYSLSFAFARDTQMSSEERREVYVDTPKKINELQEQLQNEIRDYLKNLQAIEE